MPNKFDRKHETNNCPDAKASGACIVIPLPKMITMKWFEKIIRELNLTALQITMARVLLKTNGKDAMLKYLKSIANEKAV